MQIRHTWNGMWAIYNSAGLMVSIPYVTKEKAEAALERMKALDKDIMRR